MTAHFGRSSTHGVRQMSDVVPFERPPGEDRTPGGGNGGNTSERLARIEARLEYMATREDLSKIEVLIERKESIMLRWLLGLVVVAMFSLIAALVRSFV